MTSNGGELTERASFIEEESWLRQPGETGGAFHAFCLYRDYGGDRSIRKVVEAAGLPSRRVSIFQAWSKRHRWQRRCADYDNHLDGIRREEREKAFREREKRHLEVTGKMLDLVEKRLENLDPAELSQSTITDWVKTATGLERENFKDESELRGKRRQLEISFFEDFEGV